LFAEISPLDRKLVNRGRVCGFWWRLGLLLWPWQGFALIPGGANEMPWVNGRELDGICLHTQLW
jgi:hypothetical protein